jgi:hypothetical protein
MGMNSAPNQGPNLEEQETQEKEKFFEKLGSFGQKIKDLDWETVSRRISEYKIPFYAGMTALSAAAFVFGSEQTYEGVQEIVKQLEQGASFLENNLSTAPPMWFLSLCSLGAGLTGAAGLLGSIHFPKEFLGHIKYTSDIHKHFDSIPDGIAKEKQEWRDEDEEKQEEEFKKLNPESY